MSKLGLQFCRGLMRDGDLALVRESSIDETWFYDDAATVFEEVIAFFKKHEEMPSISWVKSKTGVKLPSVKGLDPTSAYVDLLATRRIGRVVSKSIGEVNKLAKTDPREAADRLHKASLDLRGLRLSRREHLVNAFDPARIMLHKEIYEDVESYSGIKGVRSLWDSLDEQTMGFGPEELHLLVGTEKIGKTFIATAIAGKCWAEQPKPPLFVELEMPLEQIERRLYSIAGKFAYERVRKAKLGKFAKAKYFEFLDEQAGKAPFWICDMKTVKSIKDIADLAIELDVSLVLVDGVYIMARRSDAKLALWERTLNACAECKDYAKETLLPWLITSQLDTSTKMDTIKATTRNMGYSKQLGQWVDGAYALLANKDMRKNNRRLLRTLAARDFEPIDLLIHQDLKTMNFSEIGVMEGNTLAKTTGSVTPPEEESKKGKKEKETRTAGGVLISF